MAKCKFYKEIQYYSDDLGQTWYPTGLARKGGLIQSGSSDCDIPTPTNYKYLLRYSDSSIRSGSCDSTSAITSADTGNIYSHSGITTVSIGDCVKTIGFEAFSYAYGLTSIRIPNNVESIDNQAFIVCDSLLSVRFGSGLTSIGDGAFGWCFRLTDVTLPDSVTSIGSSFGGCSGLTSVTIGSGIESIGGNAFSDCTSLQSITIEATTPPTLVNTNAFKNTNNCTIYVPSSSVDAYKTAYRWSTYASRIQAIPNS